MSSRWKKVWADFWGNKSRTILTILTIMVGTFAVGINSNLGQYMTESMEEDFLSAKPSEAQISAYPLNDDMVELARRVPGVDAVEGSSSITANVVRTDNQQITILFTMLKDPNKLTLNLLKPIAGEKNLPIFGEKEMLLDASAASLGYKPGDTVLVEFQDGKRREVKLAGYIHDVTGIPFSFTKLMSAYVTPKTLEWLGGSSTYSTLLVSVSEKQTDQDHVTIVAQAVADKLKRAGAEVYFVTVLNPGRHYAWSWTQAIFFILGILGYLSVILSAFLVVNTITALMTQQTRQIGMMKAIGGNTFQMVFMYVVLILAFGLGAMAIAVPLANGIAKYIGSGMAAFLNFNTSAYDGYTSTLIQQAVVALVIPLLAAVAPIYKSVSMTVREALTDYGIGGNTKPSHKSVSRRALFLPRPMRLSLRNAFRRKTRLALTLFTLVMGGAIFIGIYNVWASLDQAIRDVQGYFLADVNIPFGRYYRFEEVASVAESVPGVTSVEGWTEYPGTLVMDKEDSGTQIVFVAPPSTSTLIEPIIIAGRWLKTGDENAVVVSKQILIIYPEIKVGDWLTIKIDEKETRWQVIGFYTILGQGVPLFYVNYEYLSHVIGRPEQVYSLRVLTEKHDGISQQKISKQLVMAYETHGIRIGTPQTSTEWANSQKSLTDIIFYFLMVMAILIAIVGGLGLMGTMSINVLERTREIGVMRAIGASNGNIQGIVITEGIVIGVIGWAVSILLSIPITMVLCYGLGTSMFSSPMNPVYSLTGILAWLIFTLVLAAFASALPARSASRLTVKDSLAYE